MKARRQIIDPLTGAPAKPDSPVAIDTGSRIVGHNTVVDDEDLDPAGDRFGIDPDVIPRLKQQIKADAARRKAKPATTRGPAFKTTMESPQAAAREFEQLNPQVFDAPGFGDVDIHDTARDFLDGIDLRTGRGRTARATKTAVGKKILAGNSGGQIARGVLAFLFAQAKNRRYRDVPWGSVLDFTSAIVDQMANNGYEVPAVVNYPIAAGLDDPDVVVARAREEIGPAAAAKLARAMNAEELRHLSERMETALETNGENCLSESALGAAKERLRMLRTWAKDPSKAPEWACVGSPETEGAACSYRAILEDVQRLESSCSTNYDPRWPIERADRACEDGEEPDRIGIAGEPCRISDTAREARTPRPKYQLVLGKLVRV